MSNEVELAARGEDKLPNFAEMLDPETRDIIHASVSKLAQAFSPGTSFNPSRVVTNPANSSPGGSSFVR